MDLTKRIWWMATSKNSHKMSVSWKQLRVGALGLVLIEEVVVFISDGQPDPILEKQNYNRFLTGT